MLHLILESKSFSNGAGNRIRKVPLKAAFKRSEDAGGK